MFKCFYSKNLRVDTNVLVGCDGGNLGVKTEENIWRGGERERESKISCVFVSELIM